MIVMMQIICVNIKNLLEYSPGYAQSTATNDFFYLDTSRSAERETCTSFVQQKNLPARKALFGSIQWLSIQKYH